MISKIKKIFKGITRKYRKYKRQKRLVRDAIRVLKRSEPYKQNEDYSLENYDVMYILENPQKSNNVWAFISYMCEEAYKFDVYFYGDIILHGTYLTISKMDMKSLICHWIVTMAFGSGF